MNEILKAIKSRRCIRSFTEEMPKREDLEKIIEAGLYAPNGMGKQSPIIIAVTNKELRDKLSRMNREIAGLPEGKDPFFGGRAVLVVLARKEAATAVYDGSLCMGNMMLAAHSLGLGSIWIHRAKQEFESEEGKEILRALGVEGEVEGIGHCVLGYIKGDYPEAAERKSDRVFWVE